MEDLKELSAKRNSIKERITKLLAERELPLSDSETEDSDCEYHSQLDFRPPIGGSVAYGLPTLAVTRRT